MRSSTPRRRARTASTPASSSGPSWTRTPRSRPSTTPTRRWPGGAVARHEQVTFPCDVCGKQEDARVVEIGGGGGEQQIQPLGWFNLEGRYSGDGKSPRLKADLCSVDCAQEHVKR